MRDGEPPVCGTAVLYLRTDLPEVPPTIASRRRPFVDPGGGGRMNPHVLIVGAGAIGSVTAPLVARMSVVTSITVVDGDIYSAENLESQAIGAEDVGMPKATACVRRLRAIRPTLRVNSIEQRIEEVPLGLLRDVDVILGCVDSRESRRVLNHLAFRRGIPFIDGGVMGDLRLARVSVFDPRRKTACMECAWSQRDYAMLEQTFACGGTNAAPASRSPAFLASIAASMQVAELERLCAGEIPDGETARELLLEARGGRLLNSKLRRNPECRFDHETWGIPDAGSVPLDLSVAELFEQTLADALRVDGNSFATRFGCRCGEMEALRISTRLNGNAPACPRCGEPTQAMAYFNTDELRREVLPQSVLATPLVEAGFCESDIVRVEREGGPVCFELKGCQP
ncbi:MAG: ThiF family adenylyltransferase [Chthoniobacteraceae bacterium]